MEVADPIQLLPHSALEKLEFQKILEYISEFCASPGGRDLVLNTMPGTDLNQIQNDFKILGDLLRGIQDQDSFQLIGFESVQGLIDRIKAENSFLEADEFFHVLQLLHSLETLNTYFDKDRASRYPLAFAYWKIFNYDPILYQTIDRIIDEQGEVRANASPALVKIAKSIHAEERALDKEFDKLVHQYKNHGWLTDNEESVRNGRRVISIKSEHKRKVQGIIHDESTTGKTSFIEPQEIVRLNNNLFDLWMDFRKEIRSILIQLTDQLRPFSESISAWEELLIQLDVLKAKANFGYKLDGVIPRINEEPVFDLRKAFHPLLLLKQTDDQVVPLDLYLGKPNRVVLLSGPNAGGKSVALKTVGLIQLMGQSSIPIPANPGSEIGLFKRLFVDIGDQQSIEDDLSTYSSRLTLMKHILNESDDRTLVLIDEFGSGTDPQIGGALAGEMLLELIKLNVIGFITTHYSNLKIIADREKGIVNAAMMFDKDTLRPTYRMRIGKPGSSFALEIAASCGLSPALIRKAKKRMGPGLYKVDQLLSNLEDDKRQIENLKSSIAEKEIQLDKLVKNYERMSTDLEVKRKKLKLRTKQMDLQYQQKYERQLERSIRELKKIKDLEEAREMSKKSQDKKKQIKEEVELLDEAIYAQNRNDHKTIEVGSFVKHEKSGVSGELLRIEKGKGLIQVGTLQMTIPVKELRSSREPLPHKPQKSVQTSVSKSTYDFKTQLDIRGLKAEEALRVVESFVDQALVANAHSVKILHGKGNGVLRKLVREKLNEYTFIESISHPEAEWGGEGITIATFQR